MIWKKIIHLFFSFYFFFLCAMWRGSKSTILVSFYYINGGFGVLYKGYRKEKRKSIGRFSSSKIMQLYICSTIVMYNILVKCCYRNDCRNGYMCIFFAFLPQAFFWTWNIFTSCPSWKAESEEWIILNQRNAWQKCKKHTGEMQKRTAEMLKLPCVNSQLGSA
jgi:hypothetical protein